MRASCQIRPTRAVAQRQKVRDMNICGAQRTEDLAGVAVVLIILASAIVAAYEAIDRLIHPQPISLLGWVALAGFIGFVGNEAVAVFRIRVGREINSAALIADGYHARTDGLTSLAVVLGAFGVWLGFPLADPLVVTLPWFHVHQKFATFLMNGGRNGQESVGSESALHGGVQD